MQLFLSTDETRLVGPAGWGEDYNWLWTYIIDTGDEERIAHFPGGLRLRAGSDGAHFLAVESLAGEAHRCTVRPIAEPASVLATALHDGQWHFDGNSAVWEVVPRFVTVWASERTRLLHIDPDDPDVDPLDWYYDGRYDLGYQGVLNPTEVPGSPLLVIPIQRDSRPVVYDPAARSVVGHFDLADRGGNPSVFFRQTADEVWVDDYDTLLRLRPQTWEVLDSVRLQGSKGATRQLIGSFWFSADESVCVVARPFSGDVLLVDTSSFRVTRTVKTGRQPLDAVVLRDGAVVARDWQSRQVVRADGARRR